MAGWIILLLSCSSSVSSLDTVFMTLFHTAEYTSCLLHTCGVPTSLTFIVLAVAGGLFGPYMLGHMDVLFIAPPTHTHTNKQHVASVDVSILF